MMEPGRLDPGRLVGRTVRLEQSIDVLTGMDSFPGVGVAVVTEFRNAYRPHRQVGACPVELLDRAISPQPEAEIALPKSTATRANSSFSGLIG